MISIIIITCERSHLLKQCLDKVVGNTSALVKEIVIWDNASADNTREVIESVGDPRIKVIHHGKNIGLNAYAEAVKHTTQPYLIELDDDIIDAPPHWDRQLLEVFRAVPKAGYIASHIIDDGHSIASDIFYRKQANDFQPYKINGVSLLTGPVGGYCTMTSRAIYDEVGGFVQIPNQLFFREDGEYVTSVTKAGYVAAITADLKVFHASGPFYSKSRQIDEAKSIFYKPLLRTRRRKAQVKRLLFAIPLFPQLNRWVFGLQPPK